MARYEVRGPDGKRYEITAPDSMAEQDVLARFQREMGREIAAPLPQDESDRALRRGANRFSMGLANYPMDAWTALVHSGRRDSPGFGEEYAQQRRLTRQAISSEGRGTAGTAGDVVTDTAAYTLQALASAPYVVGRTAGELAHGGLLATQAAYHRLFPQATARLSGEVAVPAAETTGRALPAIAELQAGQIPLNQLTRLQIGRESGRVGAAFGVGEGYGNAPDSASTADVLARMGEHGATGYALGRAIPKAINLAGDYVVGPVRNALTRRAQGAAERAQARARDFEEAGVPEFTPALGGEVVQGTASGLAGTVFGSSLRKGANQSIAALEARLAEELGAPGGTRTPAEAGEQAQNFLNQQLVGRSRPKEAIEAMTPQQLQDISGVGPGPDFNPPPPRATAEPVIPVTAADELERVRRGVAPTPPQEPTPILPEPANVPRESVGPGQEFAERLARAEEAQPMMRQRLEHALAPEREAAAQAWSSEPFFSNVRNLNKWRSVLDRYAGETSFNPLTGRFTPRPQSTDVYNRTGKDFARLARAVGGTERANRIIDLYARRRDAIIAYDETIAGIRQINEALPDLRIEAQQRQQQNYERAVAQAQRQAEETAVRRQQAAAFEAQRAAEAETARLRDEAVELARPEAEARAADRTRQLQAEADARAQAEAEAAHATEVAARRERANEPFELGRSPESYPTEFDAAFEAMRRNAPNVSPKLLGVKPPKGGSPVPRPRQGDRYTPQEVEDAVAAWEATRRAPKAPETLSQFIRRMGGIRDETGDVANMLGTRRSPLISRTGRALDDIGEAAQQTGFFGERPTVNELLARLDDDLRGNAVVRLADEDALLAMREAQAIREDLDRLGVGGARSAADVRRRLEGERVELPPEPQPPRDLSVYDQTETARLLNDFALQARGSAKLPGYKGQVFDESGRVVPELLEYLRPRLGKEVTDMLAYMSEARARGLATPSLQGGRDIATNIGQAIRRAREQGRFPAETREGAAGADGLNDTMLSRLYDAVRQDITTAARRAGPQGDLYARQAEEIGAAYATFMQDIRRPLAKVFGENVDPVKAIGQLVAATLQKGDIDLLRAFYRVVEGKGDRMLATSWLLHNMNQGGLEGFLTAYRALSQDAKRIMFQGPARALGERLEVLARVGTRLERYAKVAGDDYTIDLSKYLRPGNLAIGLTYTISASALVKAAVTAETAARILSSRWYGNWLKTMPVERGPRSVEWQRHMNRLRAFAMEELGVNQETGNALRDSFLPSAHAGPAPPRQQSGNRSPGHFWDHDNEGAFITGRFRNYWGDDQVDAYDEGIVADSSDLDNPEGGAMRYFDPLDVLQRRTFGRDVTTRGRFGVSNEERRINVPFPDVPERPGNTLMRRRGSTRFLER